MADIENMARSLMRNLVDLGGKGEIHLACDCGEEAKNVTNPDAAPRVTVLLEHVLFDHPTRRDLIITREARLMTGYELGRLADLPPVTQHEENWRGDNPPRPLALPRP
jgi:hypothetical protein